METSLTIKDYWKDNNRSENFNYCRECGKPVIDTEGLKDIGYFPKNTGNRNLMVLDDKNQFVPYIESQENRWAVRGRTLSGKTYFRRVCWDCFFKKLPEIEDIPRRARKSSWYMDINNGIFRPPRACSSPSKYFKFIFDITDEELEKEHQKFDTASLESFIRRHGEEEGKRKYEEYKKRQAYTCSKEYMMGEKGMTEEEWNQFNANRSSTKENFIKRYGKELGRKKWKEYCDNESYAGCTLEYFIDKYGPVEGPEKYKTVNAQKRLTLENFVRKYGEIEGEKRYVEYYRKKPSLFSKASQDMFRSIDAAYQPAMEHSQYATKGGEKKIVVIEDLMTKEYHVDFCFGNKIIEFNGEYFHADPRKYKPNDMILYATKSASEIWERDLNRNRLISDLGYDIHIVWERDFYNSPEKTINECVEFLQGRKKPDFSAHDDENMWKEGVQS